MAVMEMRWVDLCFLHWSLTPDCLRPLIPESLELDTFGGRAWLALVPFHMTGVKPPGWPDIPGISAFSEFNVRTYVRDREVGGVWFFSLDAAHPLAVRAARRLFHLPYFDAEFSRSWQQGWCHYQVSRTHLGAPGVEFQGHYGPDGETFRAPPGSLEEWLTERYWLFSQAPNGKLYRGRVYHEPWSLQPGRCQIDHQSMERPLGLKFSGPPESVLYSGHLWVKADALQPARL